MVIAVMEFRARAFGFLAIDLTTTLRRVSVWSAGTEWLCAQCREPSRANNAVFGGARWAEEGLVLVRQLNRL
jgi:hypothetical protein